jgi:deazaflavin-dependent oxidoreductase (nitroreductase family)
MALRDKPPAALRLAFKVPTLIYRAGLGRLLGTRFLLLVQRGRKSGLERRVVLEVIHYETKPHYAAVLSGWDKRSQWFRNVHASPPLAVWIGKERWLEPEFTVLEPDEVVEVVEEYRRNHGILMWTLDRFFGWPWKAGEEQRRELARDLTVVVFSPAKPTPDPEAPAAELPFWVRSKAHPQVNSH